MQKLIIERRIKFQNQSVFSLDFGKVAFEQGKSIIERDIAELNDFKRYSDVFKVTLQEVDVKPKVKVVKEDKKEQTPKVEEKVEVKVVEPETKQEEPAPVEKAEENKQEDETKPLEETKVEEARAEEVKVEEAKPTTEEKPKTEAKPKTKAKSVKK